jgi:hypothetical protein
LRWPSLRREELRRPGARPTPSAKTPVSLGEERVSSTAAGRIAARGRERTLYAAATLSLVAGLIHLWVTPEHFEEWWGYGAFFVVAAAAQILSVPIVLLLPTRIVLLLGIAGNLAIVGLYLLTRTVGIPFFGPEAGEVEGFGFVDVCATASEVGIAVALGAVLLRNAPPKRKRTIVLIVAVGLVSVGHVVHLVLRAS